MMPVDSDDSTADGWQMNPSRKYQSRNKLTCSSNSRSGPEQRPSYSKQTNKTNKTNHKFGTVNWIKPKPQLQSSMATPVISTTNLLGSETSEEAIQVSLSSEINKNDKSARFRNGALAPQGQASSIQVELVSFGYKYGLSRTGSSISNPLPPLDCRDLPEIPLHMARLSGLNHHVKRVLSKYPPNTKNETSTALATEASSPPPLLQKSNQLALEIMYCIREAIANGHGCSSSPLNMTVFVGSETGRHRSVVLVEFAASSVRKLLRSVNQDAIIITQLVSVTTRHRDIDQQKNQQSSKNKCES